MIPWITCDDESGELVVLNPTFITMLRRDSKAGLTKVSTLGGGQVRLKATPQQIMGAAEETLAKIAARTQLAQSNGLIMGGPVRRQ